MLIFPIPARYLPLVERAVRKVVSEVRDIESGDLVPAADEIDRARIGTVHLIIAEPTGKDANRNLVALVGAIESEGMEL